MNRSQLGNVAWTRNQMILTPFPLRLFLFAFFAHRGCQSFYLLWLFVVCLFFFFLRREVTPFSVFEHSYILNFVAVYNATENTLTYFIDRLLNNNQLKNLSSGIFSSNTHLEWPHGCSRINTWTMKCPLKHALVQENLFAK